MKPESVRILFVTPLDLRLDLYERVLKVQVLKDKIDIIFVLDDKGHILGLATEGSGAPTLGGCSCVPAPVPAGHTGIQDANACGGGGTCVAIK